MGYGPATANSQNVNFPFDTALEAARDLWKLAGEVSDHRASFAAAAARATPDWQGVHRQTFDDKVADARSAAVNAATSLRQLARAIAGDWAEARGQQDRINKARYVDHEIASDSWGENFVEFFTGEDDYGPPPDNPPVPQPPHFEATRAPMHADFE